MEGCDHVRVLDLRPGDCIAVNKYPSKDLPNVESAVLVIACRRGVYDHEDVELTILTCDGRIVRQVWWIHGRVFLVGGLHVHDVDRRT